MASHGMVKAAAHVCITVYRCIMARKETKACAFKTIAAGISPCLIEI